MSRRLLLAVGLGLCCASCAWLGRPPGAADDLRSTQRNRDFKALPADSSPTIGETAAINTQAQRDWEGVDPVAVAGRVLLLVNRARERAGLGLLALSRRLEATARAHTMAMVRSGSFSHRVGGENGLVERIRATGRRAYAVGENIFETSGPDVARECVEAWLESPDHRANLMYPLFKFTGLAVARTAAGDTYVTEDFAQ